MVLHLVIGNAVCWEEQGVALTGRNRTGPPSSDGRLTPHVPGPTAADRPPAALYRRRQTPASKTIMTH